MIKFLRIFLMGLCFFAATAQAGENTPLHDAARAGDKAKIEALLAQGADVNAKDNYGRPPLHWAVLWKRKDVAELLLAKGADVNAKKNGGNTALNSAAYGGHKDVVELLLAKGADVNAKGSHDFTALNTAAYEGHKDVVELLLAKGADVNAKDKDGMTPLHSVANLNKKGNGKNIAELLLAKDADLNAKNKFGQTPLYWAIDKDIVALLEDHILKQTNPRAMFAQLTEQIKNKPDDIVARRLIIKLASQIKPPPAIPEEARRHFVEGSTIVKAGKNPAEQALAAQSFNEALKVAPWWPDAWYNLAVAQELAGKFDDAEKAFTLYILSNPGEKEQREVQDRIYALSAKRKLSGTK